MHVSVKLNKPVEFINIKPVNPLISKCEIKVCYVGDTPNRNKSIITKDVAKELANSIPGSPIVGYYNDQKQDFEEHNRSIEISGGKFEIKDTTRPYGFVNTDAKVWFQWFEDDGVPHEYLMTEGYLWTGQYPECQRVIDKGNNQSMELDEDNLNATWTKDAKGNPQFFIINEAIMSKLCILGEDVEPCFEGSTISSVQFSFDESFRQNWTEMMNQMKEILKKEGGAPVFKYTVNSTSDKVSIENYLASKEDKYNLVECYSEGEQNFAILQKDDSFFRMNYSYNNDDFVAEEPEIVDYSRECGFEVVRVLNVVETTSGTWDDEGHEVEEKVVSTTEKTTSVRGPIEEPAPVEVPVEEEFSAPESYAENSESVEENSDCVLTDEVEQPVAESAVESKEEAENAVESVEVPEEVVEEEPVVEEEEAPATFSVTDSAEYIELQSKLAESEANYSAALGLIAELKNEKERLQAEFAQLKEKVSVVESANSELEAKVSNLSEFKLSVDREKKHMMIDKFYMLNDADKKDVIENIDLYTLDDIEAKLCVACFRNHVSFDGLDNEQPEEKIPTVYNLGGVDEVEDLTVPAFIKAVRETQKNFN